MRLDSPWNYARRAWKYRDLVRNLVSKDFKVRYHGSVLGFLWTLITPLVMILIYFVAFKFIIQTHLENFGLFLVTGILPWTFFSAGMYATTESIVGSGNLIKKVYFPREMLPLADVVFHFLHFLLAYVVFLPILIFLDAPVTWAMLGFPILLATTFMLTIGLGLFLAATTVFLVDIRQIVDIGLKALFWLTPIVYDINMVPVVLRQFLLLGPMTSLVNGYQDILYWGRWPSPDTWIVGSAWAIGALIVGLWTFRALQPRFAEEL